MEVLLLKMARQLDALDEASLLNLWNQYAEQVANFQPTKRWEEATLVLSLIQAKRWKNQLFNYHWSAQTRLADLYKPDTFIDFEKKPEDAESIQKEPTKAILLAFTPRPDTTKS